MNFKTPKTVPEDLSYDIKSIAEEKADQLSHAIAIPLFLIGGILLISKAIATQNTYYIVGSAVFCTTLVMLYTSSTLYHSSYELQQRKRFRILDHICIYFLIAGSYTPVLLVYFRDTKGWSILIFLWVLTFFGSIFKLYYTNRFKRVSTLIYLLMGWIAILIIKPIFATVPETALYFIITGAVFYTLGVVFYLWEKLYMNHFIWHLCVLGGSLSHFLAIYYLLG